MTRRTTLGVKKFLTQTTFLCHSSEDSCCVDCSVLRRVWIVLRINDVDSLLTLVVCKARPLVTDIRKRKQ